MLFGIFCCKMKKRASDISSYAVTLTQEINIGMLMDILYLITDFLRSGGRNLHDPSLYFETPQDEKCN